MAISVVGICNMALGNADLYQVGAKVTHNGDRWVSNTGNNHWEPGVYGWTKQV